MYRRRIIEDRNVMYNSEKSTHHIESSSVLLMYLGMIVENFAIDEQYQSRLAQYTKYMPCVMSGGYTRVGQSL